jgi:hypothetical protein
MASSGRTQAFNRTSSNIFGAVGKDTSFVEPKKIVSNTFKSDVFSNCSPPPSKVRPNITKSDINFNNTSLNLGKANFKRSDFENAEVLGVQAPIRAKEPKSNIHFGDTPAEEFSVKKNKTSNRDYNPDSYYKMESAYGRKFKEFYSTENDKPPVDNVNNTIGILNKKLEEECKAKKEVFSNPALSAKDRKYHEIYSTLSMDGIKKITNSINKEEMTINDKRLGVGEYDAQKDPKVNRVEFLKSNIFHDEHKKEIYQKYIGNFEEEKPTPKEPVKVTLPKNNWKAKIDWKDSNNELIFHSEYDNKAESAQERKKNDLKDHFAPERNNLEAPVKPSNDEIVSHEKEEIKNFMRDNNNPKDEAQLKKKIELSSVIQGKDFYNNLAKCAGKSTRDVSSYVVNNISDFDNLPVKEIESLFRSKGYNYINLI